jgi:hypothetical protein
MSPPDKTPDAGNADRTVRPESAPGKPIAGKPAPAPRPREIGGAPGPEPTRYGDWQHKGRVTDF